MSDPLPLMQDAIRSLEGKIVTKQSELQRVKNLPNGQEKLHEAEKLSVGVQTLEKEYNVLTQLLYFLLITN